MKNNLKDYMPLYLGCQVQTNYRTQTSAGKPMEKAIGKLVDVDLLIADNVGIQFPWHSPLDSTTIPISECKLILMDIGDMTEEQHSEWDKISTPIGEMCLESAQQIHWAKRINYYRSIGVDCDGLIEAGLAIDKNKM